MEHSHALALVVVITIVLVALWVVRRDHYKSGDRKGQFINWGSQGGPELAFGYPYGYSLDTVGPAQMAENRMYSTAEVDPLITGQLYAGTRAAGAGRRMLYGGRTAHGDQWGMHEFSTGVPGQAGVDVGLLGMREYSLDGRPDVFDDGIPENWQLPSTPVNWYVPQGRDFYDVEAQGAGVYESDLMSLQEPDHEVLTN